MCCIYMAYGNHRTNYTYKKKAHTQNGQAIKQWKDLRKCYNSLQTCSNKNINCVSSHIWLLHVRTMHWNFQCRWLLSWINPTGVVVTFRLSFFFVIYFLIIYAQMYTMYLGGLRAHVCVCVCMPENINSILYLNFVFISYLSSPNLTEFVGVLR